MGVLTLSLAAAGTTLASSAPLGGRLRWPLARPTPVITGGFGDPRAGGFHAGLDLSTQHRVGAEVLAPADVVVERVRASSSGYGRSLYLRLDDGRLVVLGHLDAFAPTLAAHVDSAQRASGAYEQDLWPAPGRFRFRAGERVAWAGESGAGPPHLHVEVRHGDFALHPLLAGYAVGDTLPPRIERVILEPLDERSWVERGAAPHARGLGVGMGEDTLLVEGRARLTVVASDATNHVRGLPVHAVLARFHDTWVECRMDSVSWAGEMSEASWLLDRERVAGSDGVILDAPAGWRPRFLTSSRPPAEAVELVAVRVGDPPRALELVVRDAAGLTASRRIWLRGPRPGEEGPRRDRSPAAKARARRPSTSAPAPRWAFAALPDQRMRIRVSGAPAGLRDVRIERGRARSVPEDAAVATWDGAAWSAVLHLGGTPDADGFWIKSTSSDGRPWWSRGAFALWPSGTALVARLEDWASLEVEAGAIYEPGVTMLRSVPLTGVTSGAAGLRAGLEVQPRDLPLRTPVRLALALAPGQAPAGVGLYRRDGPGRDWSWLEAEWDSAARMFRGEAGRLGEFALLRDASPPVVTPLAAPPRARAGPYSTWALTARVVDRASGVSGHESAFRVDGVRVPTEWDAEAGLLRWRPHVAPAPGRHAYTVEARDRAGNRTVRSGVFVITSR
jgi:hypothetical protein